MASRTMEFIISAKDKASAVLSKFSGNVKKVQQNSGGGKMQMFDADVLQDQVNQLGKVGPAAEGSSRGISKFAQVAKSLLQGNVTEASRNLVEMGGSFAKVAAYGALFSVAIASAASSIRKIIEQRFQKYLFDIRVEMDGLAAAGDRQVAAFDRISAGIKRTAAAYATFRKAQEDIRSTQNEGAVAKINTGRERMLAGTEDPIAQARINAAADDMLAAQKIKNERDILDEQKRRHDDEKRNIEAELKASADAADARYRLIEKYNKQIADRQAELDRTNIIKDGSGRELRFSPTRAAAERAEIAKATAEKDKLTAANAAANEQDANNKFKLASMKNDDAVFAAKEALIADQTALETEAAKKRVAEIAELENKAAEEAAQKKLEAEKAVAEEAFNEAQKLANEAESVVGTAARDAMKNAANALREEAARGFTKGDVGAKVEENEAAKKRSREEKSMADKMDGYRKQLAMKGGDLDKLPRAMKAAIQLDDERKRKVAEANALDVAAKKAQEAQIKMADDTAKSRIALDSINAAMVKLGAGA